MFFFLISMGVSWYQLKFNIWVNQFFTSTLLGDKLQQGRQSLQQSSNGQSKWLSIGTIKLWSFFISPALVYKSALHPWWKVALCLLRDPANPASAVCQSECVGRDFHSCLFFVFSTDSLHCIHYTTAFVCVCGCCFPLSYWYDWCLWLCVLILISSAAPPSDSYIYRSWRWPMFHLVQLMCACVFLFYFFSPCLLWLGISLICTFFFAGSCISAISSIMFGDLSETQCNQSFVCPTAI